QYLHIAPVKKAAIIKQFFSQQTQRTVLMADHGRKNGRALGALSADDKRLFPAGEDLCRQLVQVKALENRVRMLLENRLPYRPCLGQRLRRAKCPDLRAELRHAGRALGAGAGMVRGADSPGVSLLARMEIDFDFPPRWSRRDFCNLLERPD